MPGCNLDLDLGNWSEGRPHQRSRQIGGRKTFHDEEKTRVGGDDGQKGQCLYVHSVRKYMRYDES